MKRIILAALLLTTPAMAAEAPPQHQVSPGEEVMSVLLHRERETHTSDVVALNDQVARLQQQVADLTAENAKFKAPAPAEPAK